MLAPFTCNGDFFTNVCKKFMLQSCLLSNLIIEKRFGFFSCRYYKEKLQKWSKISNLANIREDVIQNLEVDIAINKYWAVLTKNQN